MGYQSIQLATTLHGHDPKHSHVGFRDRMEGAKRLEGGDAKLQNQALRKCTGAAYGSSGEKVERIAGVESVDTILDGAQTRFFARAVADPSAIGDLWPASLNPDNTDNELIEEEGRDWRDHGAYWIQNNNLTATPRLQAESQPPQYKILRLSSHGGGTSRPAT